MSKRKPKYTAKPWVSFAADDLEIANEEITNGSVILSLEDDKSLRICVFDGMRMPDGKKMTKTQIKKSRANLRLILASPDLVEILQELVNLKDYKDSKGKTEAYKNKQPLLWTKARKVIAKALGE